jgi:pyruvate/2-oxoglutarate dehydrogenase complex dihydrolipoamide dehydrogenase (E3) component
VDASSPPSTGRQPTSQSHASTEGAARFDAVVIGTGSGGKIAAIELAAVGLRVLVVESDRVGGECPYVACVPAKSILLSARRGLSWQDTAQIRDHVAAHRDDTKAHSDLTEKGIKVLRGRGRLVAAAADELQVQITGPNGEGSSTACAPIVVLATGSEPVIPPIPGLVSAPTWTSDQALSTQHQPKRLLIIGGGAVGCELGQAFALLGSETILVESAPGLLPGEEPRVGEVVADVLTANGVAVHVADEVERIDGSDAHGFVRVALASGTSLVADRLLVAGGRTPRAADLGLELVDLYPDKASPIEIDERCRVLNRRGEPIPGLFAVGDVTTHSNFTHSANYQARIVADHVAGAGHDADYSAIPRVVYIEPPVYCVGLTASQAKEKGIRVITSSFDVTEVERATLLRNALPPPSQQPVHGYLELIADADARHLVGAACVGPEADSWGSELALAIRARIPLDLLVQHVRPFPTWSEAIFPPLRSLLARVEQLG